jgi:hypothetical protein
MSLFTGLRSVFADLEKDLAAPGGPRISTMRNHSMAILRYDPEQEFELRGLLRECTQRMKGLGWNVHTLDLFELLLLRLEKFEPDFMERLAAREARLAQRDRARALSWVGDKLAPHLGDDGGLVVDILREMQDRIPLDQRDHSVVFLGRLGALYPFFRSSALLRQLDQRTHGVPVVLLYPGKHRNGGLSFMGQFDPDRDYRPRIYSTRPT